MRIRHYADGVAGGSAGKLRRPAIQGIGNSDSFGIYGILLEGRLSPDTDGRVGALRIGE